MFYENTPEKIWDKFTQYIKSFDNSYDWLMPVVSHAESMGAKFEIIGNTCRVIDESFKYNSFVSADSKIDAIYNSVYTWIFAQSSQFQLRVDVKKEPDCICEIPNVVGFCHKHKTDWL
mgnify:CR=1 FL=1